MILMKQRKYIKSRYRKRRKKFRERTVIRGRLKGKRSESGAGKRQGREKVESGKQKR